MGDNFRRQLRRASFRGAPFNVEGGDDTFGRRTVTHQYPGYDVPFTEDLGKAPARASFQGFLIGEDYIDQAKRLIDACNQPGAGALVHPWLGTSQMICLECRPSWDFRGLGECRVSLSFQEEGEARYPGQNQDYAAITKQAAGSALESFLARFREVYSLLGASWLPDEVAEVFSAAMGMVGEVARVTGIGNGELGELLADVDGYLEGADDYIHDVDRVADLVDNALKKVTSPTSNPTGGITSALTLAAFAADRDIPAVKFPGTQAAAVTTLGDLVRRLALAHGIEAAIGGDFGSRQETLAARDALVDRLDGLMSDASGAGDSRAFEALRTLETQVVTGMNAKAKSLPNLRQRPVSSAVTPALLLAYDLYQNLGREAEILGRNRGVEHPLFPPGGEALEVLGA